MVIKNFLNPKGHQNPTSAPLQWFTSYGYFTEGLDLAHWWSCIGKGLRLVLQIYFLLTRQLLNKFTGHLIVKHKHDIRYKR